MKVDLQIKRIYEPAASDDGLRILVDRVWPRGMTKQAAAVALWYKEIAPSAALRKWFGHDPARWTVFRQRYRAELEANIAAVRHLCDLIKAGRVTLLYGARDVAHNQALVLAAYLREQMGHHHGRDSSRSTRTSCG